MAAKSTERACDRCRERRVKCDKRQPTCLRCERLGRPCPGYDKKHKFVDEGGSLRERFPASPKGGEHFPERVTGWVHMSNTTADCDAMIEDTPDLHVPSSPSSSVGGRHVSELEVASPTQASLNQARLGSAARIVAADPTLTGPIEAVTNSQTPTLDPFAESVSFPDVNYSLQDVEADVEMDHLMDSTTSYDPAWFDLDPGLYYGNNNNSCGFIPNAQIVDEVDRYDLGQSVVTAAATPMSNIGSSAFSNLWARGSQLQTSAIITDEREHEMAFLIRHFSESIGPWMDLFDKDQHFAHLVPLKALRDALLRNAIAAVAAKQLGRVNGIRPFVGNQCQQPAAMEVIDNFQIDWFFKASSYYDRAIAFSRTYLAALCTVGDPTSPIAPGAMSAATSDDLLVAVSIFSLYESLDNLETGWLQHLTGLKSLLTAVSANQQEQLPLLPANTTGRLASFWNFARADYQAAYINHQKTLLDTDDMQLWRSCGLQIQDDGSLYANIFEIKNDPMHSRTIAQLVAHTLLWLLLRVTNYLASDVDIDQSYTIRQGVWDQLTAQLDTWYSHLPETFRPCAQIRYPLQLCAQRRGIPHLTEVFFSIPQCAAAIQLYHFARILLLLNKPSSGNGMSRLKAYREVSAEAIKHAREIVGIALGRPHPAVRVEMLLPLYIAGGCLEADEERRAVLDVLKAIEKDTGYSTELKVRSLIDEWGWAQEPQGIA